MTDTEIAVAFAAEVLAIRDSLARLRTFVPGLERLKLAAHARNPAAPLDRGGAAGLRHSLDDGAVLTAAMQDVDILLE